MFERIFKLSENKTTVRVELVAGLTTFLTMAYIIFVQPGVLSGKLVPVETGMDFGAVMTATCISAADATVKGIEAMKKEKISPKALQEYHEQALGQPASSTA